MRAERYGEGVKGGHRGFEGSGLGLSNLQYVGAEDVQP